ncbi:MAG: SurA N-terminal domain-containing protein [Candidatus Omnitrophica bacterium]|nr:SurA N-terminal domain-containing protein [Candidatus Omnitrophota bacterium]
MGILHDKKVQKKIWIVLVILILPAFVFWGSNSILRSSKEESTRPKIFGRTISDLEFQDSLSAIRSQAILQFGDKLSEVEKYLNLESQAMARLVLIYEAKKRRIRASDKEVIDYIQTSPLFQNKGQFDQRAYDYIVNYVFHTQQRLYEEQTRQNIMIEKLYDSVTNGVKITDAEIKAAYDKENEQLSVYYIASLFTDFAKEASVTDKEMEDYFSKNSIEFKRPLSFNLEYIQLDSPDKKAEVSEKLNKKEDLAKIPKVLNLALKETGPFAQTDPVPGIGWAPQITNLISKFDVGRTQAVQMDKNYYVIRLKERKEPYIPDFASAKDKVRETLVKIKSQKLAKERIEKCLTMLKEAAKSNPKGADFDKTAKDLGLKSSSTDLFKFGSYIENIGASDDLFAAAKNLKAEEVSQAIDMPSGYYIIKIKSHVPVDAAKFKQDKDAFGKKLLQQKKQEYFAKFSVELEKKALGNL